jgi:hypothetical protein
VKIFSKDLLAIVDHLSERLGPITTLLDWVLDYIAPKTTALANTCTPQGCFYCWSIPNANCCARCLTGDQICWVTDYYNCGDGCYRTCAWCGQAC